MHGSATTYVMAPLLPSHRDRALHVHATDLPGRAPNREPAVHIMLSSSRAASDIRLGSHGGSQVISTLAPATPGMTRTLFSTSTGSDPATGQWGEVRVIWIPTSPDGSTVIP